MDQVIYVLPDANGIEDPYGEELPRPCDPDAPVSWLFGEMETLSGRGTIRLSVKVNQEDEQALARIDPDSKRTIGEAGLLGERLYVGYNRE